MNRYFSQSSHYTIEKDTVTLFGNVAIGGTGAVGTVGGAGIASVARTGTGAYTITLTDLFNKLLAFRWCFGGGTASGIGSVELAGSLATQTSDIKAKTVKVVCYSSAATAADPASGCVLQFEIVGRNTSVDVY
jgi:hypothetical protein